MPGAWSRSEVEVIVTDYLRMLSKEIAGVPFSKAEHRRALSGLLVSRSTQSIEFKHANISAICLELGYPYVDGYKPRSNYQHLLYKVVAERLGTHQALLEAAERESSTEIVVPEVDDILSIMEPPPEGVGVERTMGGPSRDARTWFGPGEGMGGYLGREASNRDLGLKGERLVLRYEQERLSVAKKGRLAAQIEHTSVDKGDGAGYDILSFETDGRERFIEVKTTKYGKAVPFYASRNEVRASVDLRDKYHVYRVFSFRRSPKLFTLAGAISETCRLEASNYVARVL